MTVVVRIILESDQRIREHTNHYIDDVTVGNCIVEAEQFIVEFERYSIKLKPQRQFMDPALLDCKSCDCSSLKWSRDRDIPKLFSNRQRKALNIVLN
ncbi:hypothetical protein GJ496_009624 [Pomphorhynchus laevis]|nr:hypothetical protein GJ496_009624 [Pomphorhynchus laevis]